MSLTIVSGKASLSSNIPTNNNLTSLYFCRNKVKACTNSIIPLSRTNLPIKPTTKHCSGKSSLSFKFCTASLWMFCRSNRLISIPLHVPLDSSTCLEAGFNLSSILRLQTDGLTQTIFVANFAASLSIEIKRKRFNPFEVSYTKP